MDDILELVIKLLDPFVSAIGPHAMAAVAILGGLITYRNNRKQRKRERRLEKKVDFIIERLGLTWNAESAVSNDYTPRMSLQLSWLTRFLARSAMSFIARLETAGSILLRSVEQMSKAWLVGLLGYLAYFIKQFTGFDVPDEMINNVADIILLLIPLIAMFANMKKGGGSKNEEHSVDGGTAV